MRDIVSLGVSLCLVKIAGGVVWGGGWIFTVYKGD